MWQMDADAACLFFQLKQELHITTEEGCVQLLSAMAKEGRIERVTETGRSKERIIADLKAQGFNVLTDQDIKPAQSDTSPQLPGLDS